MDTMIDFRKIEELPIIMRAALSDGYPLTRYHDSCITEFIGRLGFAMPQDRKKLLAWIAKDDGASLKAQFGVGRVMYNAILVYLLNT